MTTADSPEPTPRWRWLDRWFEPQWRALLTWVALAALMGWAIDIGIWGTMQNLNTFVFNKAERMLPARLPGTLSVITFLGNLTLFLFWYEPFALRLNLFRSAAWLSIRGVYVYFALLFVSDEFQLRKAAALLLCSVLMMSVLRGYRSRPGMVVIAGLLTGIVSYILRSNLAGLLDSVRPPNWASSVFLWSFATSLPYGAVLLYGTRRLPRFRLF